jgi:predicted nucleic acid-binding protein
LRPYFDSGVLTKWYVPEVNSAAALRLAEELANEHNAALGTRSLDSLHVAWALAVEATQFVTGDERQARLAKAVRLPVTRL